MQFNIEVNNKVIQVKRGETILSALSRNGIIVPTLCSMKDFSPTGACRICVVEVEGKENLVPSCSTPVEESMRIKTHSTRVIKARKTLVELLLSNHPDDCLYCDSNGNCELQDLSIDLNIRERRISGKKSRFKLDISSPGLVREPAKCILCSRCVRVCDEQQSVSTYEFINRGNRTTIGTTMSQDLNFSSCIYCGQCILACPTGALHERSGIEEVTDALNNPSLTVVVQYDPAIFASISEEFGLKPGKDMDGIICSALQKIGFKYIFDTSFAADLVINEMAEEMVQRVTQGVYHPLISSNCPAWIKYCEQFFPDLLPMVSSCKSPQQMMGSIIKSLFSIEKGLNPNSIYSVSVVPCIARKFEAQREEMTNKAISDIDVVITARELIKLIKLYGIDIQNIGVNNSDQQFSFRSSAGKLFALSGGTTEGLFRTVHNRLTGKDISNPKFPELRSINGIKEVDLKVGGRLFKTIIVNGLHGVNKVLDGLGKGTFQPDFVEIMACPGGCINGGGQNCAYKEKDLKVKAKTIYDIDEAEPIKNAHKNPLIPDVYNKYFEKAGSDKAKQFLHTRYTRKDVLK